MISSNCFGARFSDVTSKWIKDISLQSLRQGPHESINSHADTFLSLHSAAGAPDDTRAVSSFVRSLRPEFQYEIFKQRPETLLDAVRSAKIVETARNACARLHEPSSFTNIAPAPTQQEQRKDCPSIAEALLKISDRLDRMDIRIDRLDMRHDTRPNRRPDNRRGYDPLQYRNAPVPPQYRSRSRELPKQRIFAGQSRSQGTVR